MKHYFTKGELGLWLGSCAVIIGAFFLFEARQYMTLAASLIGVTSLIFSAKGNPVGQALMVLFSLCYGVISLSCAYYGEMITYLGMTMPMAVVALVSWLKNPYKGNRAQVQVAQLLAKEWWRMAALTLLVTVGFYFVLKVCDTKNLFFSTISVTTSFAAVYLTFRRSPYYAIGYAANDVVLIILWVMAAAEDPSYAAVVVCFAAFLINDLYGFVSWRKMQLRQLGEMPKNGCICQEGVLK